MRTLVLLLCVVFALGNAYGQKAKIKGNKIVSTELLDVESFHSIEIYEGFEVTLDESSDNQVRIEADSNLQEVIKVEVIDSILTITAEKDIRRAKALLLDIFYTTELKKITLHDKASIKSLSPIQTKKLEIEVNDHAELFLTTEVSQIKCTTNKKAIAELHVSAQQVNYQINENSELKGIINTDSLTVDLYQKGNAILEGEVKSLLVRADNDTDFYGEKLNANSTTLIAEGASDCYILTNETIQITAKDKTEIYLLGEPKITIDTFANEAILYKKNADYVPNKFKNKFL
ncbi:GIN domain-containing protein [Aquimarina sp. I32.4]|uniref:GIN domain-containing protein n=1 Tax=Aquimarina sp. I32.4 TaxID=2053903 RepID=UPI000CDEE812|nr:DUF2807 domain-containing protein [Aquimarina sp. I32.4]